jgi:hypothetical protein
MRKEDVFLFIMERPPQLELPSEDLNDTEMNFSSPAHPAVEQRDFRTSAAEVLERSDTNSPRNERTTMRKSRSRGHDRRLHDGTAGDRLRRQHGTSLTSAIKPLATSDTVAPGSSKEDANVAALRESKPQPDIKERTRRSHEDCDLGHIPIHFTHARASIADLGAFNPYMVRLASRTQSLMSSLFILGQALTKL